MNADALLAIADMIEHELTDAEFNMHTWKSECGTVGCAVGHAVARSLIPEVDLVRDQGWLPFHSETGNMGISAVAVGLLISWDEAADLFLPRSGSNTRADVAGRIRKFAEWQS